MKTWVSVLLLVFVLLPITASALELELNLDYPKFGGVDISQESSQNLPGLVSWVYVTIVGISGLAAFAMIIWGGVQWMTSAGNPSKTGDAKDKIQKALLGLLIVLSSYVVLSFINPDLTTLRDIF
ncbi:MAG: hypothetical protein HY482_01010 [Candidatus Wildermuthbacteria bacterium]|nr:hypothetical protein [Candidatus Wildermuthbacteria bacterium]